MRRSHWATEAMTFAMNSPAGVERSNTEVEGHEVPAARLRLPHQPCEVEQRAGKAVELGDHERRGDS